MLRRTLLACAATAGIGLADGTARAQAESGDVTVLYAGSLVNLIEHVIAPVFNTAGQGVIQGYAGGSNKLANEIRAKLRRGDVFISASPTVNDSLMGPANGDWVRWYVSFAQSPLVIGYLPGSRFAADFAAKPWWQVLQSPGIRLGRTDPKLDPKGKLTLQLLDKAQTVYSQPGLTQRVLGAPDNPAQVLPEETLVGRLQSGELDAGFFYATETTDLHIPAVTLPPEVAQAAHYTATVLQGAPNRRGGIRLVAFLFNGPGQRLMRAHGLQPVPGVVTGALDQVPAEVRSALAP